MIDSMQKIPGATTRDVVRVWWHHARRYHWMLALCVGGLTLAYAGEALVPWFMKLFVDQLAVQPATSSALPIVLTPLFCIFAIEAGRWVLYRMAGWVTIELQPRVITDLQNTSFQNLLRHSYDFFSNSFSGALVRKVGRLGRSYEGVHDELQFRMLPVAVTLTGALVGLGLRNIWLALAFLLWAIIFVIVMYVASLWKLKLDIPRAEADSAATGVLADALTNSSTISLFTGRATEEKRYAEVMHVWERLQIRSWRRGEITFAVQAALMIGLNMALLYAGAVMWSRGHMTAGDLVLIQTYLTLVMRQLWEIGRSFRKIFEAMADAKEMVEILQLTPSVRDRRGAKELIVRKADITFKNVRFFYHATRPVLQDFSLKVTAGEKIALVGPSGAGKSTVAKLLFRFYDVDGGDILIDGQNIARVSQDSLRARIALVPQEPILFHRTLMENIRYGRMDATDAEVEAAAKMARCHDFIAALPEGYNTYVGERGVKLSGGERQRVAIARAILKNAPILVLDEATSSLDSESEHLIQEALREVMRGKTTVVIAHRLSTIMQMDRIAVVEDGRVVKTGTHTELLAEAGTYRTLWNIQAGGFTNSP